MKTIYFLMLLVAASAGWLIGALFTQTIIPLDYIPMGTLVFGGLALANRIQAEFADGVRSTETDEAGH